MLTVVDRETGTVAARRGRANLYLPGKDRLYVFRPEADHVWVRKYQGDVVVEDVAHPVGRARRLWDWLVRIGYVRI